LTESWKIVTLTMFLIFISNTIECQSNAIVSGEKIFHAGYITLGRGSCISCHTSTASDTFSFFPSVYDLANRNQPIGFEELKSKLNEPYMHSAMLSVVHENIQLSDDSVMLILKYIESFRGLKQEQKQSLNLSPFLIVTGVILFIPLYFFRKTKLKSIIIFIILVCITSGIISGIQSLNYSKDYAPIQPIKFSHKVHSGYNKIDCRYCHHNADMSKAAGTPSVALCINCHLVVREGSRSGAFELNKLFEKWDSLKTTPWVRIHRLPAYVSFNHALHLRNNKNNCANCHGKVDEMHRVKQIENLSMKWCIDCHTEKKVTSSRRVTEVMYNYYYQRFDTLRVSNGNKSDCKQCHH
jgi:hypothetical protein